MIFPTSPYSTASFASSQKLRVVLRRSTAHDQGSRPVPSVSFRMPYPGMYGRLALEHVGPHFEASKTGGLKDEPEEGAVPARESA